MIERFIPIIFENTVYEIDFDEYYNKGYRAILFDIDNTLVLHDEECNEKCKKLIDKIKRIGFKIIVLSNNHLVRTMLFCNKLNIPYISDAKKPLVKNYLKAVKILKIEKNKCLFIGDQLFTDINGANAAGITSVLVKPIGKEKYLGIKLKRVLEKIIFMIYNKRKSSEEK